MGIEQHGRAPRAQRNEQLAHRRHARRIQPGGGLVEEHQIRVAEQRQRQPESLRLASRVRAGGPLRRLGETHSLCESRCALAGVAARESEQLGVQDQDLQSGQLARKERRVGRISHAAARIEQLRIAAEEARLAGVRFE